MYKIINFPTLPSTNQYLKEHYQEYEQFTVINTDNQTNGKGRMKRIWFSNNNDLTFSILLKPSFSSDLIPQVSLIVGASICNILNKYINTKIKWPNDIIINDKKVSGILIEAITSDKVEALIVGIGVNVNSNDFSDDLIMKASSLKKELNLKEDIDKSKLLKLIIEEFLKLYNDFINNNNDYLKIIRNNNYLRNKDVYINNELVKIIDINEKGNLIIKKNEKLEELYFGEVTLNKIYKEIK